MLKISDKWTDDERLSVVVAIGEKMRDFAQGKAVVSARELYSYGDRIRLIGTADPGFLEDNRSHMLAGLGDVIQGATA